MEQLDGTGTRPLNVVLVGSYPPRRCGIGTFTADLSRSLTHVGHHVHVVAIQPPGEAYAYPRNVIGRIIEGYPTDYSRAADLAAEVSADVICLQHEYSLWGRWGPHGPETDYAQDLIQAASTLRKPIPVVTTLHTIRPQPGPAEEEVLSRLIKNSRATVVMVRMGAMILMDDYHIPLDSVVRIQHGVPMVDSQPRRYFKRRLGLENRTIVSTFGLLDPRKGIEYAIRALKRVVDRHPEVLYLVVGETHPELRKHAGEQYRNQLQSLVRELGLENNVCFVNQYLSDREVIDYLQASDIYVTPYLDRNQITSGTLAFAVGTGKAIISTPYPHAVEALAEGRGLVCELRSAQALGHCLLLMLDNPELRMRFEQRTAEYGRRSFWPAIGRRYAELFERVASGQSLDDMLAVRSEELHANGDESAAWPDSTHASNPVKAVVAA